MTHTSGQSSDLRAGNDGVRRCPWAVSAASLQTYHDTEWGHPIHDDRLLFERVCLEAFQAGLSWRIVLERRMRLRMAFDDFDPAVIADYLPADVERRLADPGIIRNRAKVEAVVTNAHALRRLHGELGSGALNAIVWSSHDPEREPPRLIADIPSVSDASTALASSLRSHGFRFVGPTTCYALMQAVGVVNDHLIGCERPATLSGVSVMPA